MTKRLIGFALLASTALIGLSLGTGAMAADVTAECNNCHGANGVSTDPNIPTIAGMSAQYLTDTLKAYKSKERPCAEVAIPAGPKKGQKSDMCKEVANVSDADMAAAAKEYAGKKFAPATQTIDPALAAKGKAIADKQCDKCHTEGGSVADDDSGILAGQWKPYLASQLEAFKSGKRPMPAKMKPKMDEVQAGDLDAVAAYYAAGKK